MANRETLWNMQKSFCHMYITGWVQYHPKCLYIVALRFMTYSRASAPQLQDFRAEWSLVQSAAGSISIWRLMIDIATGFIPLLCWLLFLQQLCWKAWVGVNVPMINWNNVVNDINSLSLLMATQKAFCGQCSLKIRLQKVVINQHFLLFP